MTSSRRAAIFEALMRELGFAGLRVCKRGIRHGTMQADAGSVSGTGLNRTMW